MPAVKDAYETTTGRIAVRSEDGRVWVLREGRLTGSMSTDEKLGKAIDLFTAGKLDAFERYDESRHGLLHA